MQARQIPVLEGAEPLLGHFHMINDERIRMMQTVADRQTELVRLRFPAQRLVAVGGARATYEILVAKARSFEKSPVMRTALFPLAGDGLFTSEGALWRRQRKLMAPIFRRRELHGFADDMAACAEQGAAGWNDGDEVDVVRETTRIAMSVAGKTLFDADFFDDADDLGAALTVALNWVNRQFQSPLLIVQAHTETRLLTIAQHMPAALAKRLHAARRTLRKPLLMPGARTEALKAALRVLERRVEEMIRTRRQAADVGHDLMAQLLRARDDDGNSMSDKQVRDEVLTLFVAGHETTAIGLAWSLYLLAQHPQAYQRAQAEADAITSEHIGFDDVQALPFCLRVFKEALRMYPPIYLFGRQAIEPVTIAGYPIACGTIMLLCPYAMHHRADFWPHPKRFDPDRFLPEAEEARPREAFLPFSDGPRTCIGNHFALLEAPIVLATLLRRARFTLTNDRPVQMHPAATLRPKGSINMRVHLRS